MLKTNVKHLFREEAQATLENKFAVIKNISCKANLNTMAMSKCICFL
jgi:hypothetical protein